MFCSKCGTEIREGGKFCPKCGTPAGHHEAASGPAPMAAVAPAPVAAKKGLPKAAKIGIPVAAVAVVVVLCAVLVPGLLSGPAVSVSDTGTPAVQSGGKQISALVRPTFLGDVELQKTADGQGVSPVANVPSYTVEPGLSNVSNADYTYVSDEVEAGLVENGFYVDASYGDDEFFDLYEKNRYDLFPNFVTVDSMMHTYHLYFSHLLKNTEKGYLSDALLDAGRTMLDESAKQHDALVGTPWEEAATRNVVFFAVGARLLDDSVEVPGYASDAVSGEVSRINDASGIAECSLTGTNEDYTQYIVRGYYKGDAQLERYFRAMMWYGRINFTQSEESLDRSAALMTLALHGDALESWEKVYVVTSFFAGASDDCGYYEYYPLLEAAYGENPTVEALAADEGAWAKYHELTAGMPAPKINSVVVYDEGEDVDHLEQNKGYRFMGQRFSIDAAIMQQLVYNKVGKNAQGEKRGMPDALDVPAALGSDEALSILEERGATGYSGYTENMHKLRTAVSEAPDSLWTASLYSQWLYTLNPLLEVKGEGYPAFMQSSEWTRKNLQSYLGSYTELKHDTVLLSKQVMVEMGGGPIEDRDDRGYVEPETSVYQRLSVLVGATRDGLDGYLMLDDADRDDLNRLQELADQLAAISEKELAGETLSDGEYDLIRTYGGQLEHFWQEVYKDDTDKERFDSRDFPAAIVTDVATNADTGTVLELGTGRASTIYVVVPVDGTLRVASGSVFSFYQFEQPMSDRLTDTAWREMMGIEMNSSGSYNTPSVHVEDWTSSFQSDERPY